MLAVSLALVCSVAGCSSGGDGATSGSDGVDDDTSDDAAIVAFAAVQLGQRDLVLDAATAERHLFVLYQVNGDLDADAARCATERFVESFGGRTALEGVALADLLSQDTQRARRDAARSCEPEAQGPATTVDPFEPTPPQPFGVDVDPALLRDHLVELTAASARAVGLDEAEAGCFATQSYGLLDDQQILAVQRPDAYPEVDLPERDGAEEVLGCVDADRIAELAAELRDEVDAARAAGSEPPG